MSCVVERISGAVDHGKPFAALSVVEADAQTVLSCLRTYIGHRVYV